VLIGRQTGREAPADLEEGITTEWPQELWGDAVDVAYRESGFKKLAVNDSLIRFYRTGEAAAPVNGIPSSLELSIGYFQVNVLTCPPDWEWLTLVDAHVNAWAAYQIYQRQGWAAWFHTATGLGLI
jgi:hypothetical protein